MAGLRLSRAWRPLSRALAARLPPGGTGRNAAWMLGGQLTALTATLIATPIQLDRMGSERYGLVVIAAATVGSLIIVDAGAGWAVMRAVPWHRARGDHDHARQIASSALLISGAAGLVVGGAVWLFAGDIADLFRLKPQTRPVAVDAFHVVAILLPVTMVYSVIAATLRTVGMYALIAVVAASMTVGLNVVWAVEAGRPDDVVHTLEALVALTTLGLLTMLVVLRRRAPEFLFPMRLSRRGAGELLSFGGKSAAGHTSLVLVGNMDKIGLAAILPVAVLPTYSIPFSIATRVTLGSSAVGIALLPRMAGVASLGDREETRRLGLRALRVSALANAVLAVMCVFAGGAFLELWVNPGFADSAWGPLIALAIGYGVLGTGSVGGTLLDATGRPGLNAAITAVGSAVALTLGISLAAIFDTALAAAIGVSVGLCLIGATSLVVSRRLVFGTDRASPLRVIAAPWLAVAGAGAGAWLVSGVVSASPLLTIGLVGAAVVLSVVLTERRSLTFQGSGA